MGHAYGRQDNPVTEAADTGGYEMYKNPNPTYSSPNVLEEGTKTEKDCFPEPNVR